MRFPGGAAQSIRAAAEATGSALPESFTPPELEPENYFPYQAFWHLKRGEDRIKYHDVVQYSDRHRGQDADELVVIMFALDDVFEKHQAGERKKQAAKNKMGAKKRGK